MKEKYNIGQFLTPRESEITAHCFLSGSKEFRTAILSGLQCTKIGIANIQACMHADGQVCKQIRGLDPDDVPQTAKGFIFFGDHNTQRWHCCSQRLGLYQFNPCGFEELKNITEQDYDDYVRADSYGEFPSDENILTSVEYA